MYEITCLYCGHDNWLFEIEGLHNKWVGHTCEKCKQMFFILQKSWFDPTEDLTNVEVCTAQDLEGLGYVRTII